MLQRPHPNCEIWHDEIILDLVTGAACCDSVAGGESLALSPPMLPLNFPQQRSASGVAAILIGALLIAAGIILAFRNLNAPKSESTRPPTPFATALPSFSAAAPSPTSAAAPTRSNPDEVLQTLERFQTKYESLSGKGRDQENFFTTALGKRVTWTVRVDNVFRTSAGVIVVFSSMERPDWAAFPISDARFPLELEKPLMSLSRGNIIRIDGRIADLGIKTLECSSFEIVRK